MKLLKVFFKPMSAICMHCNFEAGSMVELTRHMKTFHVNNKTVIAPPKKKEVAQQKPEPIFKPPSPPIPVSTPQPVAIPQSEPIVLEYRFKGQCNVCLRPVSTIGIDVSGKRIMLAYCKSCDKDLLQVEVIPIGRQKDFYEKESSSLLKSSSKTSK